MRGKYIIISILITIILFFMLMYIEKKIVGADSKTKVLVVKSNVTIDKYEKLDASMFEIKQVPSFLASNAVSSLNDINSKYALFDLMSNEVLRKEKIGSKNDTPIVDIEAEKRKLAISVSSLADGVAGQLRRNTYVDILFTNSPTSDEPTIKTETVLQKVKVIGVTDSNGVLLDDSNNGQIAAVLLSVTPQEAHTLVNKERKGKFRLIGVPEGATSYEKIVVR